MLFAILTTTVPHAHSTVSTILIQIPVGLYQSSSTSLLISHNTMSYSVTRSSPVLVPPAAPTPSGILHLSSIDRMIPVCHVPFVSVFSHGEKPGARIKEAFAKALVSYYPVAGRIVEPTPGVPVVDCTGEGIWYVTATANFSLEDVNYLETGSPLMIPIEEILPPMPTGVQLQNHIFFTQITEFTCGGFAVGICFNHRVFDGQGAGQFLKAVGDMARGLPELTVNPVWSREVIPDLPEAPRGGSPPSFTPLNFVSSVIDIPLDNINRIKDNYTAKMAQKCSTFDVVTAMMFKSRVKAIKLADTAEVRVQCVTSLRHLAHAVLPSVEGYYGNCVYSVRATKTSKEINCASILEVITLIKDAKDNLAKTFVDLMNGNSDAHYNMPLDYGTVTISDWRWLGFGDVDYGWGKPKYIFNRGDQVYFIGWVVCLVPPVPKQGIRLTLKCVKEEHCAEFCEEMLKF